MYCRKCGKKIDNNVRTCPFCGTDVIELKQRTYSEQYKEEKRINEEKMAERRAAQKRYPKGAKIMENRYLNPAVVTSFAAFLFALIPWPRSWNIGSSLWMKILVLLMALLAVYHCVKANQISNHNKRNAEIYNKNHPKDQIFVEKPKALTVANALAILTAMVASFSLFMSW